MNNIKSIKQIIPIQSLKEKKDSSYNILDYLEKEFATFEEKPFCEIDALILSQLCYLNFSRIIPGIEQFAEWVTLSTLYKAELFEKMTAKTLYPNSNLELIKVICANPRYRDIKLNYYLDIFNKTLEEQFSATTFMLSENHIVIAYRGTDLTVTGWKEDFNMFFISPVPSQLTSVKYLNTIAGFTKKANITLVGHSKGGNLAVYSNAFCKAAVHKRVLSVYNLDGPGFPKDILENIEFIKQQDKITKIVPEGSIIGLMFEDKNMPTIIKSNNLGFLQHDPFSWKCQNNKFVQSTDFSYNIKHLDKTFNTWVYQLDLSQRKTMVDTLFTIVSTLDVENLDELALSLIKQREEILKVLKDIDDETTACIKAIAKSFFQIALRTTLDSKRINELLTKLLPSQNGD